MQVEVVAAQCGICKLSALGMFGSWYCPTSDVEGFAKAMQESEAGGSKDPSDKKDDDDDMVVE